MAKEDFKVPDPRAQSDHLKGYMLNYLNKSKHKIKEGLKIKELKYLSMRT